ncbi:TetR/AcrR family transcriptional regulator [Nannocystis radixulma]|uniref:TetR/AcrR family transcriptional regulator n=1 Tax=Nannocystis radixulma TaxID=2995305 RepID=A0ABT5B9Y4_9BACT|nr:TetR/AcrR family transcriptional regulator [Nannocystis radixulma]MDC0670952.1 TetR/AcrR family transcriptional regulator [Nannocystis radixulma]
MVRTETRAAYREAILDAATRVFGRLGFQDAKMADIAAEAGVAAGTVYNYFKNKEEVFRSILQRTHELVYQRILVHQQLEDPIERMRASTREAFAFLEEHGALFLLYVSIGGGFDWAQKRIEQALIDENHARYFALSQATMRDAAARGLVRSDIPIERLSVFLSGLTDAVIFSWVRAGCEPGLRNQADPLIDFFLNGARAP